MTRDEFFMNEALIQARKAKKCFEVPIGAVIVRHGKIIAKAHNTRETDKSPLAHAEILAIEKAAYELQGWRLTHCEIYVTLEPCLMCAGAIYQGRIDRLIYGATDLKAGAVRSLFNVLDEPKLNHKVEIVSDVLKENCQSIISDFFKKLRQEKKEGKSN